MGGLEGLRQGGFWQGPPPRGPERSLLPRREARAERGHQALRAPRHRRRISGISRKPKKKRPMELQRRLTRRKKKSALNSIWRRRCEPLEPGHIANAKHRNEIFRVIIVSDPFVRRSKFSHHLR